MPNYRRAKEPGSTFFITIVTHGRRRFLTEPNAIRLLESVYRETAQRYRFVTHAFCVLPDHIHALVTLPRTDGNFSRRCQYFKSAFTRAYLRQGDHDGQRNVSRRRTGEAAVWQRRFWEHTIRNDEDFRRHFDYIHFNPVKHGLAGMPEDWRWSTYHRYIGRGWYEDGWGEAEPRSIVGLEDAGE